MTEIKITFKKPVALSSEMKESLAHCYQMEGFRKYLENMLNALIVLSAMKSKNEIELSNRRGAIEIVEKILGTSKSCWNDYNKIKEMEKRKKLVK